jgi:hypothetical protein
MRGGNYTAWVSGDVSLGRGCGVIVGVGTLGGLVSLVSLSGARYICVSVRYGRGRCRITFCC